MLISVFKWCVAEKANKHIFQNVHSIKVKHNLRDDL